MRRKLVDGAFVLIVGACAVTACGTLLAILGAILYRGLPAISWGFLTEQIRLVGADGGILYNLLGTLLLVATALGVAAPLAVGLALTHSVYVTSPRGRRALELFLYALNGVPSILFGVFGLIVFVKYFGWEKSWLAGGILLGVMILPTVTTSLVERIRAVPRAYADAAAGLGLSRSQIVRSVVLPQSLSGLVTGSLLGVARAAGETAPIMFTATVFAGATWPRGIKDSPVLSLPYHIFTLAQDSFDPNVAARLWGTAAVLLALVFTLSLVALPLRLRIHEEARNG
jgi:phosphate transport system permease protein